jgi:hypothetical protein
VPVLKSPNLRKLAKLAMEDSPIVYQCGFVLEIFYDAEFLGLTALLAYWNCVNPIWRKFLQPSNSGEYEFVDWVTQSPSEFIKSITRCGTFF